MKVTLDTKVLKDLTGRVMKGVGDNPSIMRTCWIGIKCSDNELSMTSWDGENYLVVREPKILCDDFKVTVTADKFAQLVSKTTTEKMTLELTDKYLKVKGNGEYKLQLPVNDEGELDNYPEIIFNRQAPSTIKLSSVVWAIEGNKISLAKTAEKPCLMCYMFDDAIYTSNDFTASQSLLNVFKEPVLLRGDLVNLVATMENEVITVYMDGNKILFETPKTTIMGYFNEEIAQYQQGKYRQSFEQLFATELPSSCTVSKADLLSILDRILLFVKAKDEGVRLLFTENGIQFYNKDQSVNELLPYKTSNNFNSCEVKLQLDVLKDLVSSFRDDDCSIQYGVKDYLKFGKDKRFHILTVLGEETTTQVENTPQVEVAV